MKTLKIDDQISTDHSSRPLSINSDRGMKKSVKVIIPSPVPERLSSESRKSTYFRMTTNSFEPSREKSLNNHTKSQLNLPNISQSPKAVETDRTSNKKKTLLTNFSDNQAFRIAPNTPNTKQKTINVQDSPKSKSVQPLSIKTTIKHLQLNQKNKLSKTTDPSSKNQDNTSVDFDFSPLVKKALASKTGEESQPDTPTKRPSYLNPTIARIQAQRARPANLSETSRFHFGGRPAKPVEIMEWSNRGSIEEPFSGSKHSQSQKGQGSPTSSPAYIPSGFIKKETKVGSSKLSKETLKSQVLSDYGQNNPSVANIKVSSNESLTQTDTDAKNPELLNQDYFNSEPIQKETIDVETVPTEVIKKKKPQTQQQRQRQANIELLQQQKQANAQEIRLINEQAQLHPKSIISLKEEHQVDTIIQSTDPTPLPMPRLISRLSLKGTRINREDGQSINIESISTVQEEEETGFKAFKAFWEKESLMTEEQKKAMLFQPANINFFRINNDAPIIVSMNSNNRMIEKHEDLTSHHQKEGEKTRAIFAHVGEKNQIIQPDYMRESGTMCFTDLWSEKQKTHYFASVRKTVKKFKVFNEQQVVKSQWDSVYRPEKIKNMNKIKKKITGMYTQDAIDARVKQEEAKKSSNQLDLSRRPSVFLSTESTRNRIADTFGDMSMSFLVSRIENSTLNTTIQTPNNRRQSRWANQNELKPNFEIEKVAKSNSEGPLLRKQSVELPILRKRRDEVEQRIEPKMKVENCETVTNGTGYEISRNEAGLVIDYGRGYCQTDRPLETEKDNSERSDLKVQYQAAYLLNKKLLKLFGYESVKQE